MANAIATRYNYASLTHPSVDFSKNDAGSKSVTNQSDKDSSDINKIMARYEKTGLIMVDGVERVPHYGDFTGIGDYHQLQITLAKANEAFAALPASTRNMFENDPAKLIEFLSDPNNDEAAVKLGLRDKKDLPVPNVWDKKLEKWTSGKDGKVLDVQPPAPAAPAAGQPA